MASPSPIPAGVTKEQVRLFSRLLLLIHLKAPIFDLIRQWKIKFLAVSVFAMLRVELYLDQIFKHRTLPFIRFGLVFLILLIWCLGFESGV